MNRARIFGTLMLVIVTAMGCSEILESEMQEGSLTDPTFKNGQSQWEAAIAQAVGSIDFAMDYSFVPPSDTVNPVSNRNLGYSAAASIDTFNYSYDVVTGWHVASAVFADSGISGSLLDSVQFQDAAGQVMEVFSDVSTDRFHVISDIDIATDDTIFFAITLAAHSDLVISNITSGMPVANGTFDFDFVWDLDSCAIGMDFAQTLTNVVFPEPGTATSGVCPTSGSMHLTGSVNPVCTGSQNSQNVTDSWTVDVIFNNDSTMSVTAQTGNTVWNYSGNIPCGNYYSLI